MTKLLQAHKMTSIKVSIPPEILDMVASFLSLKDTKNFRRSSKAFSDIGARYLMVDTVTLTPHHRPGQNMLEDVGKNDVLRRYIKNLRIDTRQFSPLDSYEEFLQVANTFTKGLKTKSVSSLPFECMIPRGYSEWTPRFTTPCENSFAIHRNYMNCQNNFHHNFDKHVLQALKYFPNLVDIVIGLDCSHQYYSIIHDMMFLQLEGVARLPIYMPKAVRWSCHPFSSVFCSTLSDIIDAIRNTPVIISNLSSTVPVCIRNPEFDGGLTLEECLGFEEPVPPVFQRSGSQVSRQLTSLKLSISTCLRHLAEPDPEATTLQTTIQEIMYSCLNLRLLCLKQPYGSRGFGRFDHTPYLFGQEGGRLIFPHLQKLHLENFRLTANTTLAILHRYKNSLKEIVIGNIESMKGLMANTTTAEWGTLLDSLRDMDFQSFQIREPSEAIAFVSYEDLQQKSEFWLRATDYVQQTLDGNPLTDQLSSRNTYLSGPNTTRDQVVILGSR